MDAPTLFILLAFVGQPEHWSPINFYSTHEQCENALMAPQFNKNGAPPVKCVTYIANSQSSPETRKEELVEPCPVAKINLNSFKSR